MTLGTFIYILLGRTIGLAHRQLIMIDQNRYNLRGLVETIRLVFGFAITLEAMGGLLFGSYFLHKGYVETWYEAFYYGFFHALSSYTNAGFDIFGNSLVNFSTDYFVQTFTIILRFFCFWDDWALHGFNTGFINTGEIHYYFSDVRGKNRDIKLPIKYG